MKVTIIPIVIGAFDTVTKGLLKGAGGLGSWWTSGDHQNVSTIWERPEYWEESWRLEETYCHSNADVKNSKGSEK